MEKGTILIVLEAIVEFVLPDDASSALEVDYLEVKRSLDEIAYKSNGALNTSVAPLRRAWMSSIDTTDGSGDNLVAGRRNGGFHLGFVRRRNGGDRGHGSRMAVMLFSSPAGDNYIRGQWNEQRQEKEAAVWEAQIDWFGGYVVRVGGEK